MLLQLLSSIAEVEIPLSSAKAIQAKYLPSLVQFLCTTGRNIVKPAGPISNGMIYDKVTYVRKWKNRDREAQPVANLLDSEDTYQVKNYFMNHPVFFLALKKKIFLLKLLNLKQIFIIKKLKEFLLFILNGSKITTIGNILTFWFTEGYLLMTAIFIVMYTN